MQPVMCLTVHLQLKESFAVENSPGHSKDGRRVNTKVQLCYCFKVLKLNVCLLGFCFSENGNNEGDYVQLSKDAIQNVKIFM